MLHQAGVSTAIAGSRDGRRVAENAAASEITLGDALEELDALIPLGPTFKAG